MIKHATASAFVFCDFPTAGAWTSSNNPAGVMACPGGHVEDDES